MANRTKKGGKMSTWLTLKIYDSVLIGRVVSILVCSTSTRDTNYIYITVYGSRMKYAWCTQKQICTPVGLSKTMHPCLKYYWYADKLGTRSQLDQKPKRPPSPKIIGVGIRVCT